MNKDQNKALASSQKKKHIALLGGLQTYATIFFISSTFYSNIKDILGEYSPNSNHNYIKPTKTKKGIKMKFFTEELNEWTFSTSHKNLVFATAFSNFLHLLL